MNAKNNEREGAIIAQAGQSGAVTVATNVAGRGVDILLGGNPPDPAEAEKVRALGGLHVIGTDRHEARRIDNQLARPRGTPGRSRVLSQFFLSLEDDLLRVFGGDRIKGIMERFDLPEDQPIEFGMVTKAVAQAQEKVEGANFDLRKHLLEYDDVLNKQRGAIYKRRQEFLGMLKKEDIAKVVSDCRCLRILMPARAAALLEDEDTRAAPEMAKRKAVSGTEEVKKAFADAQIADAATFATEEDFRKAIEEKSAAVAEHPLAKNQLLGILDMLWMTNLEDLEALQESVAFGRTASAIRWSNTGRRQAGFSKFSGAISMHGYL